MSAGYFDTLDFSKVYCEGDCIRIVTGSLKNIEGKTAKVDKCERSGQVTVRFGKRDVKQWLGFYLIEKPFDIDREYSFEKKSKVSNVCRVLHPYKLRMI